MHIRINWIFNQIGRISEAACAVPCLLGRNTCEKEREKFATCKYVAAVAFLVHFTGKIRREQFNFVIFTRLQIAAPEATKQQNREVTKFRSI